MSELNKIFDVKSREARRKILDNYPISANDKNEVLNKIGNSSGENTNNGIKYYKVRNVNLGSYEAAGLQYLQYCNCINLKVINPIGRVIITQGYSSLFIGNFEGCYALSFTPGYAIKYDANEADDNRIPIDIKYCSTIEELEQFNPDYFSASFYITDEITEEEYFANVGGVGFFIYEEDDAILYSFGFNKTWEDFVNSEESKQKYIVKSNNIYNVEKQMYVENNDGIKVKSTDIITFDCYCLTTN